MSKLRTQARLEDMLKWLPRDQIFSEGGLMRRYRRLHEPGVIGSKFQGKAPDRLRSALSTVLDRWVARGALRMHRTGGGRKYYSKPPAEPAEETP